MRSQETKMGKSDDTRGTRKFLKSCDFYLSLSQKTDESAQQKVSTRCGEIAIYMDVSLLPDIPKMFRKLETDIGER